MKAVLIKRWKFRNTFFFCVKWCQTCFFLVPGYCGYAGPIAVSPVSALWNLNIWNESVCTEILQGEQPNNLFLVCLKCNFTKFNKDGSELQEEDIEVLLEQIVSFGKPVAAGKKEPKHVRTACTTRLDRCSSAFGSRSQLAAFPFPARDFRTGRRGCSGVDHQHKGRILHRVITPLCWQK